MATGLLTYNPVNTISQGQVQGYQSDYGNSQNEYNQNQSQLQDFQKNMQSGTDMYAQQLQAANRNASYDPSQLAAAQRQVQQIQGIMGGLPRAVQASNANYGATAGDVAGQYSTEASNLNQSQNLANTAVGNQLQSMQGGLTGAQAGTTAGLQGQQQKLGALQSLTQNALSRMDQARQTMVTYEDLYQKQGQFNADQQRQYEQANAMYTQAMAQANMLASQSKLLQQEYEGRAALGTGFGYGGAAAPTAQPGALNARQQSSANFLKSSGATPQSIRNYSGPSVWDTLGGILHNSLPGVFGG